VPSRTPPPMKPTSDPAPTRAALSPHHSAPVTPRPH
jgi:hypothetical protein